MNKGCPVIIGANKVISRGNFFRDLEKINPRREPVPFGTVIEVASVNEDDRFFRRHKKKQGVAGQPLGGDYLPSHCDDRAVIQI